ncbi:MAG: amino acid adenylation domain-containing protein [Nostoc sp.]|uniref:amino acid adenylation domain-containing protein n=1 Tax=Nostoc sp. TaxID=1180 RepID=UPI002FFBD108
MDKTRDDIIKRRSKLSPEKQAILEKRLRGEHHLNTKQIAISRRTQQNLVPLSAGQQRLWFVQQLEPQSSVYNEFACIHLQGILNLAALEKSFNEIVKRHESLRTSFETLDEQPVQVIHHSLTLELPVVNLSNLTQALQDAEVERLTTEITQKPFDLASTPLLRGMLLQTGEQEHLFLLVIHHIVCDGWSIQVLNQELAALYTAFSAEKSSPLSELPIQYADYSLWQHQWLQDEREKTQLSYWKQQLTNAVTTLDLPADRPRPPVQSFSGSTSFFQLSPRLTDMLRSLSKQQGVTLFMTLLAAFQAQLYRYTSQEDICIGSPIANRNHPDIEGLIGFFVNILVLRTDLSGNPSFLELLNRVRAVCVGAYAHAELPFERLVGELHSERNLSHTPLFQVMFALQQDTKKDLVLPGLTLKWLQTDSKTNKFDLTLHLVDAKSELSGWWEYNNDLFDAATINRMTEHFTNLLEGIVSYPEKRLSDLPLLTESERQTLLVKWNDTEVKYPQQCIHELFEAQVEKTPDAVAVVFEEEQLTYQELNSRANQLGHYLQDLGVKPEVLVGICVERSLSMVIGLLAILKAGGGYIPLDPNYPQERLAYMLEDSQPRVLLTQQHLVESLPTHKAKVVCIDGDWRVIANKNTENPTCNITCDNLAYVIYTSGSTGKPKGAMNTHRGICNRLLWMQDAYGLTTADIVLQKTPFSFDVSVWEFFWPLLTGARLVVAQPEGHRDPNYLVNLILQQQITTLHFVPAMLQVFLSAEGLEKCQSLVRVFASGEALPAQLQQRFFNRLDAQLHNLYGPTEAAVDVTFWECKDCVTNQKIVPIGRPIANIQIYLLDKYLNPVAIGVTGEVYIGGVGIGRGYLNRPELTAEKFIPNPFSDEAAHLYKTGDLARYLANGEIEYIGRIDYQVKIRGFRIELGEIEAAITQHPTVRETVVVVCDDSADSKRLVAYVVLQKEQILTTFELRDFLESKLPSYMIPSAFIILEALPLTPNGKVDRKALPIPESTQILSSDIILPSTPIENLLAGIWAEILGIEKVGIDNNFFELGGHSLIATRVISQIRQVFQVELPLRDLFEKPTIAGLAKEIEKAIEVDSGDRATNIERIARSPELPLSFAQQRLWFLAQLEPNSPFYNIPAAVLLEGQLNVEALQQSFNEIISRHEALRTNFQTREGQAIAVISEAVSLTLIVFDISDLSLNQQEAEVKKEAYKEAQKPFDLKDDLLLRVKLLHLGQEKHIILLTMHHIVSDGWSIGVLVRELATLYQAFCDRQPSPLPALPIQYVDFAAWQRQWLQGEVLKTQISYWLKQLENAPKVLELPTDYPRPAIQTFRGSTYSFKLSDKLSFALNKLSQQQGSTLFMTLLAAFKTLLWRYTGSEDIVVGSPIANRNRAEIEGLIGFFVNTLVLRTNLVGNPCFEELLKRVRKVALEAYAHQDLPFELLVEELQPERDLSHTPLFQVMFVLQNAPMSALELPGLTLSPLESNSNSAKLDLTLYMTETADGLIGNLEYNTDLFEESSIQRMAAHLQMLLEGIVANPQQCLSELPLLTESERCQLMLEWNDTEVKYPQQCIHELFEAQVEKTPDAVAVVFEEEQLTYQELNSRANQLGHYLQDLGVKPEVLVGICVERSLSMVIGLLAILKAGGGYIPLDPNYPQERLAYMLEDSQPRVLLTQQHLVESLPTHKAKVVCIDGDWRVIANKNTENPTCNITCDNLAYVIYTSGSTGKPKGAMNTHRGICNRLLWMQDAYGLTTADIVLQKTPFSFDVSVWEFFWPLLTGARLVVAQPEGHRDPNYLVNLILQQQITTLHFVPAMLQVFLSAEGLEKCQSLVRVFASGEALPAQLQQRFFNRLDAQLHNLYGPTEAAVDVTFWECKDCVTNQKIVPIGRPIANIQIYLLDKYLNPVAIGVTGEVYIGGVGIGRGYLNRPELTAEKFIPNPFSDEAAHLYKTGDLARYLANGEIEYIGRIDYQVKIRGFRIELGEIEAAITQHPTVRETVVVVCDDSADSKRLVAYVVLQKEQILTTFELRDFLESKLPSYMIPSAFIILEALPLTPNGKVDRKALPALDTLPSEFEETFVAPQTAIEKQLAIIWMEVLGLEKLGVNDNFFELGGHSLFATQVISRINKSFEIELPLRRLFELPTVTKIAQIIEDKQLITQSIPPFERVSREIELPLSFAQKRLWFLDQLASETSTYNMSSAVYLNGHLDIHILEQSFKELLRRQELLRTTFGKFNGVSVQIITPSVSICLPIIDLNEISEEKQFFKVQQSILEEAQRPFDLAKGPLLRVSLLRLGEESYVLLLVMHHIISDGWSIGILIREFSALYAAFLKGEPSPLPELPIQYADFAYWQNQWLQGEVMEKNLSYWKQQLANLPVLELPTDYPRPEIQTFRGSRQNLELPKELCEEIKALSGREGVTLFMTLVAAFKTLMHYCTNQDDIVVGTDVANRNFPEIENIIGFFVNQLVLRTYLGGDPTFQELLKRVHEVTLAAYEHQDMPFDQLVLALKTERDLSRTPLFQSKFVLQNFPTFPLELEGLKLKIIEDIDNGTAKFDLLLTMWESKQGLSGSLEYSTDLFNAAAIAKFITDYEIILRAVVAQPNIKFTAIKEILLTADKQRQDAKQQEFKQARRQKFKAFKSQPKATVINLSQQELITESFLQFEGNLPLVITPKFSDLNLPIWAENNQQFIINNLFKYGGILFRGFAINQKEDFEQFVSAVCPQLMPYIESSTPRTKLSEKVYTSTEFPADQTIALHNESSYSSTYPMKIWFCCIEPANQGGETPIANVRKVFQRIHPQIRERFQEKGWMLVRNYGNGFGLPWQKAFHTADKAVMEDYCRNACIQVEWKDSNRLRTRQVRPAIAQHPKTGEMVWFNHVVFWHVSSLQTQFREKFLSEFTEEDLPYNTFYGDGSSIEDSVIAEIREAYRQEMIIYPWEKGDILMLDNMLTAHGRNPYSGSRKILTAMGEPFQHHF